MIEHDNANPESFFKVLEGLDDEHFLVLQGARIQSNDLELAIEIRNPGYEEFQTWKISCLKERGHLIVLGFCNYWPEMTRDHVLLWSHNKPVVSLYFHGKVPNVSSVVGDLFSKHRQLMGDWAPFTKWFNPMVSLSDLLGGGYGLLAEGPEPLILAYKDVLTGHGLNTSLLSWPPKYWDGNTWIESTKPLVALTLSPSFIVAEALKFEKLKAF